MQALSERAVPLRPAHRAERTAPPMAGRAAAMRPARERRLAGPAPLAEANHGRAGRPGKAARGALAAGEPPGLPGPPAGGFPGVLPLAGRGKCALTCVKLRPTLSSNAELGGNGEPIEGTSSGERRYNPNSAAAEFPAKRAEGPALCAPGPTGCMPPGGRPLCGRKTSTEVFRLRRGHAAPRTGPQQRPGAAAEGRGGGANGRQCCRRIRGARLDWRPR